MSWPKFAPLLSSLIVDEKVELSSLSDGSRMGRSISSHPFNQFVNIIVPRLDDVENDSNVLDKSVFFSDSSNCSKQFRYFLIQSCPLHLLTHPIFFNSYVRKGKLFACSINCDLILEDCVSLSSGLLTLSLIDMTYRRLGLIGHRSTLVRDKKLIQKYIVEIDLNSKLIDDTSTKYFQRTFRLLRNSGLKFDFLLKWEPEDERFSSLSIVKFFEWVRKNPGPDGAHLLENGDCENLKINLCQPKVHREYRKRVICPATLCDTSQEAILLDPLADSSKKCKEIPDFETIDWIGAQLAGVNMDENHIDSDVSDFFLKNSSTHCLDSVNVFQYSGFFTSTDLLTIISSANSLVEKSNLPFVAVVALGFENSCITWEGKKSEHGIKLSGENSIGFILKKTNDPKTSLIVWRLADSYDFGIENF
ncbi:ribonuclease P protein subunit p40-like [Brevipalpus obovatus]|uniref:ribonuclease P protein subunit p40-like n=1 Tax=Brevipalpus obovatus TaxID=246614 RepID=UPI003D9ED49B